MVTKLIRIPISILVVIVAPLLTLLVSLATIVWVGILRRSPTVMHKLVRYWGKVICLAGGISVTLEGAENLSSGQPYIFAANHQSQYDILALQGYLPVDFRWLAKKELFKVPVWGPAMKMAGYIPVDRSHGRQAMKSLTEAAQRIADGTSVIIFPEGTRSADGTLQPFKAGGMVLAIKSGVPLVPVAIIGTHEVLPKGSLLVTPGKVLIRIGTPIKTQEFRTSQKHDLALELHESVADLLLKPS